MSARITIQRPRLNPDGSPVLDDDGAPIADEAVVERRVQLKVGDEVSIEDWDWDDLPFPDAVAIEAAYGGTLRDFRLAVANGSMTATQILIWTLMKRTKPAMRLAEVNLPISALHTEFIDEDVEEADPTLAAADAPASETSDASTSPTSPTTTA